jgi:Peptidase family M20/M25/M40
VHVSCLIGAVAQLAAARETWSGTLLAVFQPAEEIAAGSRAMIDDGLYDRFDRPDVMLGQHVAPLPAGMLVLRSGPAFAGVDVTLHGSGGHGSRPETTVDPVVMAASTVLRLQTIVARELAATDTAVLSVGTMHAGTRRTASPTGPSSGSASAPMRSVSARTCSRQSLTFTPWAGRRWSRPSSVRDHRLSPLCDGSYPGLSWADASAVLGARAGRRAGRSRPARPLQDQPGIDPDPRLGNASSRRRTGKHSGWFDRSELSSLSRYLDT